MKIFILCVIIISALIAIVASKYNEMVKHKNKVNESLSLIDIQLRLRFDLVPNLVKTVQAYAKHEKEIFEKLIEIRKLGIKEEDEKKKIEYANELVPQIGKVLAVAENYPELKADALYRDLMEELVLIEDKIAASRRFYDSNVSKYNTLIEMFPNNLFAFMFSFKRMELFKIDVGERFASKIKMDE